MCDDFEDVENKVRIEKKNQIQIDGLKPLFISLRFACWSMRQ